MFFNIYIYSKNYNSIQKFVNFLNLKLTNVKFNKINKTPNITRITLLKSPHVNKTAQEQFSFNYFTKNFVIKVKNPILTLFIIKFIKQKLFLDVKFKINLLNNKYNKNSLIKNKTHPNNFNLFNCKICFNDYIQVINNYGKSIVWSKNLFR